LQKKRRFFEFLNFNLKSTFLRLNQVQRVKKTSFSNSASSVLVNSYFFTFFRIFFDQKHSFESNRNRVNSTRAFELCINCNASPIIIFFDLFCSYIRAPPPYVKNRPKYSFIKTRQFIHHSKALE
jgi:hypothetical protein